MRTYVASAHAFKFVSTDLGGTDDTVINVSTCCVRDDFEVSIHEVKTNNGTPGKCYKTLVYKSILRI
jgi:hypothetical protein